MQVCALLFISKHCADQEHEPASGKKQRGDVSPVRCANAGAWVNLGDIKGHPDQEDGELVGCSNHVILSFALCRDARRARSIFITGR